MHIAEFGYLTLAKADRNQALSCLKTFISLSITLGSIIVGSRLLKTQLRFLSRYIIISKQEYWNTPEQCQM